MEADMEGVTPTTQDVASKIMTRSRLTTRSASRNRSIQAFASTPSEDTTPRTLIGGILEAASVSKSGFNLPKMRKSKLTKSPPTVLPAKRNKVMRQSLGDNATPRTIIKNFLMEASPETPLEVPPQPVTDILKEEERDTINQTMPYDIQGLLSSSLLNATHRKDITEHEIDHLPNLVNNPQGFDNDEEENDNSLQGVDENRGIGITKGLSPASVSTESDTSKKPTYQADEVSARMNYEQEPHESDAVQDSSIDPSMENSSQKPENSRWKDLVTPHLPIKSRNILSEEQQVIEEESEKSPKTAKKPPQSKKMSNTKSSSSDGTNLPSSLVKNIFQHFSKSRISRNTLQSIEKGSSVFFKQISSDLMAYSQHAGRSTIDMGDVELLMKRQGFITDKQSLNSLIEKYLPLEYRQELIPVVQSGNKIMLKKT